jgi:polyisoprenyl-teichoic acid--peptidoglycan teichoic acid transferase
MKKKSKWKVIGYTFLGILIIGAAIVGYEYKQLQPNSHFKTVPVVSTVKDWLNSDYRRTCFASAS